MVRKRGQSVKEINKSVAVCKCVCDTGGNREEKREDSKKERQRKEEMQFPVTGRL